MKKKKQNEPKRNVSFSQFGSYNLLFEYFITHGLEQNYVRPPEITKRTMELGNRNSPDFVCSPFKFTLGCFLEAIEAGADTIVQVGGVVACRLKYYGSMQKKIIEDLGYDIRFVNLAEASREDPRSFLALFRKINPDFSLVKILRTGITVVAMLEALDRVQLTVSKNAGFELRDGDFDREFRRFCGRLLKSPNDPISVYRIYRETKKNMRAIPTDVPEHPLRIAVIGEYYTVMDDYSSHNIEKKMAKYGMRVERWMNVSHTLLHYSAPKRRKIIRDYVQYDMGVTTTSNVGFALECAKKGFDGIIQLKSFGCTPEIDAMPVLRSISSDYDIPILFFSFDCQNADTGIETRLEAFYDMIRLKKEAQLKSGAPERAAAAI
ncbi:MAG: hypothetical protein IJK23_08675 [Clostridia bacterium]|nr:hypothetical protein [Clostridia bacterium]